jgi:hypothetical protein
MTDPHPIAPPSEVLDEWLMDPALGNWQAIAIQAAQWGADQELEACLDEVSFFSSRAIAGKIRAARRPRWPSLKERLSKAIIDGDERKALKLLEELDDSL